MALGINGGDDKGHYESVQVIDTSIVSKIEQNNADISNYQSLINKIELLKGEMTKCKNNLDCCYNNASLGVDVEGIGFNQINNYAETIGNSANELNIQIENINEQINLLKIKNSDLEKFKYKTVQGWVLD